MEQNTPVQIDVDKILQNKSPRLHKWLPQPVISYLKHIVHQNEVNDVLLRSHNKYYDADFADFMIRDMDVTYRLHHEERIPHNGKLMVVSNHPLGGLDGILLISILSKHRNNIKFPVNDLLMHIPNLSNIFVPINKTGRNYIDMAQAFENMFKEDNTILYFPAGICSRKIKGKITDIEWKKTFVSKARQYEYNILPVHFEGKNSNFFYNMASLRKLLGIRTNIEMLYLADEFFRQKGSCFHIHIGKLIPHDSLSANKNNDYAIAQQIKEYTYSIYTNI